MFNVSLLAFLVWGENVMSFERVYGILINWDGISLNDINYGNSFNF